MKFSWHAINPFTSLFGKIFIWFWLTVVVLLSSAFFVGKMMNQANRISLADEQQISSQLRAIDRIETLIANGVPFNRAIRRQSNREFPLVSIINPDTKDMQLAFPLPMLREPSSRFKEQLFELAKSPNILLIKTSQLELIGPFQLQARADNDKVFFARILKRHEQVPTNYRPVLALIILIGTLLCLLLAWRLSKPLQQLRDATNLLSEGHLNTQIKGYENRRDEIGYLARDFNRMALKLSSSIEQQQRLMANISHELRTPLTRLQLSAAMLTEATEPESVRLNIQRIEREISILDELIGKAIELAKMSLTQLVKIDMPELRLVKANTLISDFVGTLEFEAEASSKIISKSKVPDVILAVHEPTFISAVENLTRNAMRFASQRISLEMQVENNWFMIYISDDGKGLTHEEFCEYVKPFSYAKHQGDGYQSIGLGLAIANAGIELHNGHLSWSPSRLGGLTVLVKIPLSER